MIIDLAKRLPLKGLKDEHLEECMDVAYGVTDALYDATHVHMAVPLYANLVREFTR